MSGYLVLMIVTCNVLELVWNLILLCYISAVIANVLANLLSCYFLLVDTRVKTMETN